MERETLARELLPLAQEAVAEASELGLRLWRQAAHWAKDGGSPVSEADLAIQELVAAKLRRERPDFGFVAEESGADVAAQQRACWVLDPIDGTEAYVRRLPFWCVALGLCLDGEPVLGLVQMPAIGEIFTGGAGLPALRNDQPVRVLSPEDKRLAPAIFAPSRASSFVAEPSFKGRVFSCMSVAAHVCYVAAGAAQAVLLVNSRLWDVCGPLAILAAAGGAARHRDGSPLDTAAMLREGRKTGIAVAGHPDMIPEVYSRLKSP